MHTNKIIINIPHKTHQGQIGRRRMAAAEWWHCG